MEIRRFERDDLDGVVAVEETVFPHEAMPGPTFVQFGELYPSTFLVAEDDSRIVGYALVAPSNREPGSGLVIAVGVLPESQGRGIGRALMEGAIAAAAAAGMNRLELTVSPQNEVARTLYEKLGFVQDGEVKRDYFGAEEHRIRMTLPLRRVCDATDSNLQAEAATSVAWSNLLVAVAGATLAGLIAVGSVNPVAYWYIFLALLGALYSSQYYANVSGVVGRLHRNHDPERLMIIGNSLSEYLSFYPLVLAMPLVMTLLTQSLQVSAVALLADLLMFGFYQLGSFNVESRQAGHGSSLTTYSLMAMATASQVAAYWLSADLALLAMCVVATAALIWLTFRGAMSAEV